jgi:hypothetical protein
MKDKAISTTFALCVICIFLFLWRHGMHLKTGLDEYVVNPQLRVDLFANSSAIEALHNRIREPYRVVGVNNTLFPGYNGSIGLESIYGCDPLINPYFREIQNAAGFERQWDWRLEVRPEDLCTLIPICDMLNVKYYLAPGGGNFAYYSAGLVLVDSLDLDIYESKTAWPRAFFSNNLRAYNEVQEFISMLRLGDSIPLAAAQKKDLDSVPELATLAATRMEPTIVPASNYSLSNNTTSFQIVAPNKGVVVLTESYLDGDFHATINGKNVPYYRLNHMCKGVVVPEAGTYEISFSYWPRHFTLSLWMSGIGLLVLTLWSIYALRSA